MLPRPRTRTRARHTLTRSHPPAAPTRQQHGPVDHARGLPKPLPCGCSAEVCPLLADLDDWTTALDLRAAGQWVRWMDDGRRPAIQMTPQGTVQLVICWHDTSPTTVSQPRRPLPYPAVRRIHRSSATGRSVP
ncbi:DUF5959 family protein [Streptomyces sp. NBC_00647]|uniref:DUF5959 family protein n=1 Tax=Streptomyces sp. NBC_00647 TaxID=2975796 RepID=UPI00386614A1